MAVHLVMIIWIYESIQYSFTVVPFTVKRNKSVRNKRSITWPIYLLYWLTTWFKCPHLPFPAVVKWPTSGSPAFNTAAWKSFPVLSSPPYTFVYELNHSLHNVKPQATGHVSHSRPLCRSCTLSTWNTTNEFRAQIFCWLCSFLFWLCVHVFVRLHVIISKYLFCLYARFPLWFCPSMANYSSALLYTGHISLQCCKHQMTSAFQQKPSIFFYH